MNVTTTNYELPNDPYHDYEIRLEFGGSTGIRVRPNEKSQMIEDALMERITLEVYGDVRVRLEEYLNERGIADEPREELEAIVEMMR